MLQSNNTSGCTGVRFYAATNKWVSEITKNKRRYRLGSFEKYEDAVKARKKAEIFGIPLGIDGRERRDLITKNPNPLICCLASAKKRAKKVGVPFSLKIQDLIYPECCAICSVKIFLRNGGMTNRNTANFDRIIPHKGYISGNWQWLCWDCNRIKSNCTEAWRFRAIAENIERKIAA